MDKKKLLENVDKIANRENTNLNFDLGYYLKSVYHLSNISHRLIENLDKYNELLFEYYINPDENPYDQKRFEMALASYIAGDLIKLKYNKKILYPDSYHYSMAALYLNIVLSHCD